jgi:hypothetical protein
MKPKLTIFTLCSARSATLYLKHLFQNNLNNCICRHEPFFDWGNPTLFGGTIYNAYAGRIPAVRSLLLKKRRYIERLPGTVYLESSHAFLKSAFVAAYDVFPDLRLVHLIRDPVKVARSEAYREHWRQRVHAPFHYYRGDDGRRHFAWALTGNEQIFGLFAGKQLSLFQWYLIQWIEIENRAMRFLEQHQLHDRCFTLHVPEDINSEGCIRAMFEFFGLALAHPQINFAGRKNRSLGYSMNRSEREEEECAAVLEQLPSHYLEIFTLEPYERCPWSLRFKKPARSGDLTPRSTRAFFGSYYPR